MMRSSVFATMAMTAALAARLASAQFLGPATAPPDPAAQFEAASIKPADPSFPGSRMMMQPGRLEITGMPARQLLRQAFRVQDYQIVGAPDWLNTERYSIVAKAPDGSSPANMPAMIANLLKDRFKLTSHAEKRDMPIFNLVLARSDRRLGEKLAVTSAECEAQIKARQGGPGRGGPGGPGRGAGDPGGPGPGGAGRPGGAPPALPNLNEPAPCGNVRIGLGLSSGSGQPIGQIVQLLAQFTGRPVVDMTGLTGVYDFNLRWAPDPGMAGPLGPAPPGAPAPVIDPDAPNLFTAVQEQLGLKLENARGPVDVIVVDRIERPTLD